MLKAIETEYNGYRFRSRLEARQAVFFDTLGIPWEYEEEGYDLDGVWYLPDFWLPELKCWVENKGQEPTKDEHMKCCKLMKHAHSWKHEGDAIPDPKSFYNSLKDVYLFVGNIPLPDKNNAESCYRAYCYSNKYPEFLPFTSIKWRGFGWMECPFCCAIQITFHCSLEHMFCVKCGNIGNSLSCHDTPRLLEAYKAARSARFERGR